MKKMLNFVGVLIVMSTHCVSASFAQATSGMGSGMFPVSLQRERDIEKVDRNFSTAIFSPNNMASLRMYKNLDNFSGEEIRGVCEAEISRQLGEEFHPERPDDYTLDFKTYEGAEAEELWRNYEDGYIYDSSYDHSLHFGNPLDFKINREDPDIKSKRWRIAIITSKRTGRSIMFRANCGNPLRPVEQVSPPSPYSDRGPVQTPSPCCTVTPPSATAGCRIIFFTATPADDASGPGQASTLSWSTTCPNVDIAGVGNGLLGSGTYTVHPLHTTTYRLTCAAGTRDVVVPVMDFGGTMVRERTWFGKNAGWVIPLGLGIIGTGIYLGTHHGHSPVGRDNVYDNGFQGGSGPSGASGGEGSQKTTYAPSRTILTLGYILRFK
jgi:hypothetical protein